MTVLPIYSMPFSKAFMIFMMFSVIGWISEVIYVGLFVEHKFVNRGFLHGPLCPVYGFGGVVILLLPPELYSTWIPLFFASMILCTIVEYFVSWILEKMFHTLWWDYSHFKFNIKGRVCLLNALLFGAMGMLVIHFVMPYIMFFLNWLGEYRIQLASCILGIVLSIDIVITVRTLVDFHTTMEKFHEFAENLKVHYGHEEWFHGESLSEMIGSVKEHAREDKEKFSESFLEKIEAIQARKPSIERIIKNFPTMKSTKYKEDLSIIRKHLKERIKK